MKELPVTQLKELLAGAGYKDIRNLGPKSFGIVVAKTKVPRVVPDVLSLLAEYKPKAVSDVEVRVGDKSLFAKNANMQRGRAAFTMGRGNEHNLKSAIEEYREDYGKPITIEFTSTGRKFVAKDVMKINHVGTKNIFERNKADIELVTSTMKSYPISIKDTNAGAWESADTYWGARSKSFLLWALEKKHCLLEDNGEGGYSVRPPIAIAASTAEIRDVVFGADIYKRGAVVVQKFAPQHFTWDFNRDVLVVNCQLVITQENDVKGGHEVYFQIRNDKGRNPQFLHRGLRTIAAMKNHLQGVKVFEKSARAQAGL